MKGKQKKMNLKRVLIIGLTLCGIMPGVGAQEFNEGITGSKSTDEIYVTTGVLKDRKYTFTEDTKIHVNNHSKNAVFYKEVNESGGQKSKIWIMAGISNRNGKVNIDAKGKELTVGLGYEKPKENESPIEWPAGIYVSGGKSITIDAKKVRLYNAYEGKMYGGDVYFGIDKDGSKLTVTGDLDLRGEKNGRVEVANRWAAGELAVGGSYYGGHISDNYGGLLGKITVGGNVDIEEDNARTNFVFKRYYTTPVVGLEARDITVGGNVNICINSENHGAETTDYGFYGAMGIQSAGRLYIGGNVTMRGRDPERPWGIYVFSVNSTYKDTGAIGIKYSGYDGAIRGDVDLKLRTMAGILVKPKLHKHTGERGKFYLSGNTRIEMDSHLRAMGAGTPYVALCALDVKGHADVAVNMGKEGKQPGNKNVQIDGNIRLYGATEFNNPSGAEYSIPKVTLALTNKDSHWTGVSFLTGWYEPEVVLPEPASFNLYLRNGARWNNRKHGAIQDEELPIKAYTFSGSEVTRFYGGLNREGRGIVHMHDTAPLTIGEYEGHTLFYYDRIKEVPTALIGGDLIIKKAKSGSAVTLRTGREGLDLGKASVTDLVLNTLAHKLVYEEAKTGKSLNLKGTVEIAEGLTSASAAKTGTITFDKKTGRGKYKTELDTGRFRPLTTSTKLTEGKHIIIEDSDAFGDYPDMQLAGVYNSGTKAMTVDLNKQTLVIGNHYHRSWDKTEDPIKKQVAILGKKGTELNFTNGDKNRPIVLAGCSDPERDYHGDDYSAMSNGYTGDAIVAEAGSRINIEAPLQFVNGGVIATKEDDEDVLDNGYIKIKGDVRFEGDGCIKGFSRKNKLNIDIEGDVYFRQYGSVGGNTNISGTVHFDNYGIFNVNEKRQQGQVIFGKAGNFYYDQIHIPETHFGLGPVTLRYRYEKDAKTGAVHTHFDSPLFGFIKGRYGGGGTYIGMSEDGKRPVEKTFRIHGGIDTSYGGIDTSYKQTVRIGMVGKNAYWHGTAAATESGSLNSRYPEQESQYKGNLDLYLQKGAVWDHEYVADISAKSLNGYRVSTVTRFHGGKNRAERGVVYQKTDKALMFHTYEGNAVFVYDRSKDNPDHVVGGNIRIWHAEPGAEVTLRTSAEGIDAADRRQVETVMDNLAQKLYYQAYVGEKNTGENGERNLKGKLEIAEGLTAVGMERRLADIRYEIIKEEFGNYDQWWGQGRLNKDSLSGLLHPVPESQTVKEYKKGITGNGEKDKIYKDTGVLKKGTYTFSLTPTTITAEKPIAAEKDITVKAEGVRLVLKTSGGNKTAIETGKHTVTMQGGSVDTSGGNINIAGGRLNAHADTTAGNIEIKGGGTVYASGNLTAERVNISGKPGNVPSKLLIIPDEKKKTSVTKVKTIKLTNGANLWTTAGAAVTAAGEVTVSGGSKLGTKGTFTGAKGITVENGSVATIDGGGTIGGTILARGKAPSGETGLLRIQKTDITRGSRIIGESGGKINLMKNKAPETELLVKENAKAFFYDGGVFGGSMTASGKNALITANKVTINEGTVIKAEKEGHINIRNNSINKGKIIADNGTVSMTEGTFRLGDVEAKNKGRIYLNTKKKSSIEGNITIDKPSTAVLQMKGSGSVLKGNITGEGTAQLELGANGTWEGTMKTGSSKVKLGDKSVWIPTENTDIGFLNGSKAYINMSKANKKWMKISNYSGNATFCLDHSATEKENKGLKIKSGGIVVRRADKGSRITLRIDNKGLKTNSTNAEDKALVEGTLDNLAGKLSYVAYAAGQKNLKGRVEIAEGLTSPSAALSGDITFTKTGKGSYRPVKGGREKRSTPMQKTAYFLQAGTTSHTVAKPTTSPTVEPAKAEPVTATKTAETAAKASTAPRMRRTSEIIYGDKETQMMRGSKTAMTAAALLWRGNNNDLERRMGDIRLGKEESGIWARYLGGKNELDKQKTSYKQTYNIAQAGYDKKKGNWTIGMALDYGTGKDTYANGTGKEKLASLSLYGTMQKEDGQYLDIILKGSRIKNDYSVYNEMNHRLDGKYRTSGLSVSVEYGKRSVKENGFYIEPSLELTAGHLSGKDYEAVSDYAGGKKMHIHQDGVTSVIGRIGLGIGKETERTSLFAKIGLSHEFGGTIRSTFSAEGEPTSGTEVDMKDSWVDVEVGGSLLVNRNTYLYGTYTRNFGADLSSKWRIDAGIRFSF
ncbi:autotransporter outer membrane beta-barrel domain-containing protein [Dialister invisus]|uniref:autotransporter outer membrane beta-barrel domain-containing protein n=1 Tax=Dialister invisus TaxID=218538 RepID=UPI003522E34B